MKRSKGFKKRNNGLRNKRSGEKIILSVISFIEDAMRALSNYRQQLKNQSYI